MGCIIRAELGVEPGYLSMTPDANGDIKQELTLTTEKNDLSVSEVRFLENSNSSNPGTKWQTELPLAFKFKLTKGEKQSDDYIAYKLEISMHIDTASPIYGQFTIVTNHPKKKEVTLQGAILGKKQ
ncbi:MAG: hypothetical protein JW863_01430 [Chitinispirillaceae bacterium]|nr:hypothetical protein [Chitinispirillaceae bacterium]